MPPGDLGVEVFEQADASVAAAIGAGGVARQLEEVEAVGDPDCAREIRDEDDACLQRRDEQGFEPVVIAPELAPELADACLQLPPREVDLAEATAAA
jgi:hypothetical protein